MKKILAIALVTSLNACGAATNSSAVNGTENEDPVTAQFRNSFREAAVISENLTNLSINRTLDCALQEGVKGEFRTGSYTQKFSRFANFVKSEITFDDLAELQTFANDNGKGLMTQINGVPNHMVTNPVEIYLRVSAEGYLVQEWTVHPWEYLYQQDLAGRTVITAANSILDRSLANPNRYVIFYGLCE